MMVLEKILEGHDPQQVRGYLTFFAGFVGILRMASCHILHFRYVLVIRRAKLLDHLVVHVHYVSTVANPVWLSRSTGLKFPAKFLELSTF